MSDASCLENVGDLPGKNLTNADDNILRVYQYWVHQDPGTHLDSGIEEDSKWQDMWKNWLLYPPNAMTYCLVGLEIDFLEFLL